MNAPASNPAPEAHLTRARLLSILGVLTILLVVCAIAGLLFGTAHISLERAFSDPDSPDHAIFFAARLPRVLMGVIVGAMLAAVGTALQALVRNPLAEGGILGISGGGALGAILALVTVGENRRRRGARPAVRIRRGAALDGSRLPARDG